MSDDPPLEDRDRREGDRRSGDRRAGDRRRGSRRGSPSLEPVPVAPAPTAPVPAVLEVCDADVVGAADLPVKRIVVEDRRRHERIGLRRPASMKHRIQSVTEGLLTDISAGGARFTTTHLGLHPPAGSYVSVSFDCRHGERRVRLTCIGRVVRTRAFHDGEHDVRSISVQFAEQLDIELLSFA